MTIKNAPPQLWGKYQPSKPKCVDRLFAFIDILGFKELVFRDSKLAMQAIDLIDGNLRHVLKVLKGTHGKLFSAKLFSDCICVSCDYSSGNISPMLYELAFVQLYLALDGIFLRGALSRGLHFENDRMIFSQGLISAYELEQKAIYPRIIVHKDLADTILIDNSTNTPLYTPFKAKDFLVKSPDGYFFIDYLNLLWEEGFEHQEELSTHKKAILSNVRAHIDNAIIVEKYRWLAEYHNVKFKEFISPEDYEKDIADAIVKETAISIEAEFPQFSKV
jgi:hypothetical protein